MCGSQELAEQCKSLAASVSNESFQSWLCTVAPDGSLAQYLEKLISNYDTVSQVVDLYAKVDAKGLGIWTPDFFTDLGIQEKHKDFFASWIIVAAERISPPEIEGVLDGIGTPTEDVVATERISPPEIEDVVPVEQPERRLDPDDGKAYTWLEFHDKFHGEYSAEDISSYWKDACIVVREPDADQVLEQRIDPDDGKVWNFNDFKKCYQEKYSDEDIVLYWKDACTPIIAKGYTSKATVATQPRLDSMIVNNHTAEGQHNAGSVVHKNGKPCNLQPMDRNSGLQDKPWFLKSYKEKYGIDLVEQDDAEPLRIDPDEQRPFTAAQFMAKYSGQYDADDLRQYWLQCCQTVLDWKKGKC